LIEAQALDLGIENLLVPAKISLFVTFGSKTIQMPSCAMTPVYTKIKNNCKRRPNTYLEKVNSDLFSHLYVKPMQPKFLEDLYDATNKESLQMLQTLSLLLRLKIAIPKHLARRIS